MVFMARSHRFFAIQVVLLLQGYRQEWQYLISGLIVLFVICLQTTGTKD